MPNIVKYSKIIIQLMLYKNMTYKCHTKMFNKKKRFGYIINVSVNLGNCLNCINHCLFHRCCHTKFNFPLP